MDLDLSTSKVVANTITQNFSEVIIIKSISYPRNQFKQAFIRVQ